MKAYHFLKEDMRSGCGNEPAWKVGEKRTIEGNIALCERGYHSSPSLWQALAYAPGPVACLVEIPKRGTRGDTDKSVSKSRKLLAAVNIERELRLFAADCAEHILWIYERDYPNDDRPRKAIEAARKFARGEINNAERAAARDAARAAAWDAAWDAARDASWAAAWAAARDAAWAAARAAARAAETEWQRAQFEARLGGIFDAQA